MNKRYLKIKFDQPDAEDYNAGRRPPNQDENIVYIWSLQDTNIISIF